MASSDKKLTSKDIFDLYKGWHEAKFPGEYTPLGFIGNELSAIKKVAEDHGVWKTLCGLYTGLRDSERPTKATYLMKGYWKHLPECTHPELYYLVLTKGTDNDRLMWRHLMHVETKWFPDADDASKMDTLIASLEDSLNGKKKPKKEPKSKPTTKG